jgi:hypothetical protein
MITYFIEDLTDCGQGHVVSCLDENGDSPDEGVDFDTRTDAVEYARMVAKDGDEVLLEGDTLNAGDEFDATCGGRDDW